MARPRDPRRRVEILDAVLDHLAEHGMSGLSMRPIAQALGQSTRVLTHHFADKDALLAALLKRLDEIQHEQLHATEGWDDTDRGSARSSAPPGTATWRRRTSRTPGSSARSRARRRRAPR
ncbi:TetR family transcriptional regulator [Actinomadura madurae]|uniref:TetR family transcriptional regulator n=1 Tax=Actinomadura madurae TaxID=1993 RepID=UPI0027E37C97|nr:TetR family transcriptional regulator [Actinomadura madurae]